MMQTWCILIRFNLLSSIGNANAKPSETIHFHVRLRHVTDANEANLNRRH